MKTLIFAAGLGTRLKPLTDSMPKALVPVNGKPLLAHVMERLISEGATEVVVNVHHFAEQVKDYLRKHDFGVPVGVSDETACLLDTGGGLRKALGMFTTAKDEPVLIHNVDILSNAPLRQFYETHVSDDAALLVSSRDSSRQLYFDDEMRLHGWKNLTTGELRGFKASEDEKSFTPYAFSGIHLFSPRLSAQMEPYGERFPIMDFYLGECGKAAIRGEVCKNLKLLDVGKTAALEQAAAFIEEMQ